MTEVKNNAVASLEQIHPMKLVDDQRVQSKFINLYNHIHGTNRGELAYEAEKFHFIKQLTEKPDLQACTRMSLYGAFLDVSVQGLSLDPTKKLAYLIPYNVNAGTRENPKWEKRCNLAISPYGELYLRQMYGQIRTADNPEVVFEGEKFSITTDRNGRSVNHEIIYPRPTGKIIAVYFRFVKADGNVDYGILDATDMERLRGYSARKNNGNANALYGTESGGADKGFFIAKCIKHAFRAYPKVNLKGNFSKLDTDRVDEEETTQIDYSLETTHEVKMNTASPETMQMTMAPASKEKAEPVTVDTDDPGF